MGEFTTGESVKKLIYNGETMTMYNKARNAYAKLDMPATIEGMIDTMATKYGVVLPLGDLVLPNAYGALTKDTISGQYMGLHMIGNDPCHHIAFTQDAIDWEIWIEQGDKPAPRKFRIIYKKQPGKPRFTATMSSWVEVPKFPASMFEIAIPADAEQVDVMPVDKRRGQDVYERLPERLQIAK